MSKNYLKEFSYLHSSSLIIVETKRERSEEEKEEYEATITGNLHPLSERVEQTGHDQTPGSLPATGCVCRASKAATPAFHLIVERRRLPMYWLHLEVASETTLATLDHFLRDIWLECCGHLSSFEIEDVHYYEDEELLNNWDWGPRRQSMHVALAHVLHPGQTCLYDYDFGSTTELTLKVPGAYQRESQGKAIRVLARNTLPPLPCDECGSPAVSLCKQCVAEDEDTGYLCETCAETHACGKESLVRMRRVNSPRAGVCGYTGPTNPEYL